MEKIYEGSISCKSILESNKRKCICLYVDKKKDTRDFRYIKKLAKSNSCPVKEVSRDVIDDLCQGKTHGGICLKAQHLPQAKLTEDTQISGFCAYIDGVEDPYNLGSIARTLYASGCDTLLLPMRDWSMSEHIILKASAGAFEKQTILWVQDDEQFVSYMKSHQIPIVLASRKDSISLQDYTFPQDFCVCIGGALRGISSTISSASSQNLHIEYGRDFRNALDTASAVAVFAFTISHQRKEQIL